MLLSIKSQDLIKSGVNFFSIKEKSPEVLEKKLKENQKQLEKATNNLQQKDDEIIVIKEKLVS